MELTIEWIQIYNFWYCIFGPIRYILYKKNSKNKQGSAFTSDSTRILAMRMAFQRK